MQTNLRLTTCKRTEDFLDTGTISAESARHLFRVAAGIESPLVGETAILGQLRRCYQEAKSQESLTPNLNRLFQQAIHVGRRVRKETAISRGAVSYSQVAVEILSREIPDLSHSIVSIIGVNELTESVINFLRGRGAVGIILANRSIDRAQALADKYGATVVPLAEKQRLLSLSDAIVSATSAPHSLIHPSDVTPSSRTRLFIDLANPRDVDPEVANIQGVRLYDLQRVESEAHQNIKARQAEIAKCETIIEEEVAELLRWESHRPAHQGRRAS